MTISLSEATAELGPRLHLGPEPLRAFVKSAIQERGTPNCQLIQSLGATAALVLRTIETGSVCQLTAEPLLIGETDAGSAEDLRALAFLGHELTGVHIEDTATRPDGLDCASFVTAQQITGSGLLGVRFVRTVFVHTPARQRTNRGLWRRNVPGSNTTALSHGQATYSVSAGFMASRVVA